MGNSTANPTTVTMTVWNQTARERSRMGRGFVTARVVMVETTRPRAAASAATNTNAISTNTTASTAARVGLNPARYAP